MIRSTGTDADERQRVRLGGPAIEHGNHRLGDARRILPERRQLVRCPGGHWNIVEADDRDFVGHPETGAAKMVERAEGHEVVDAEQRVRRTRSGRQQTAGGLAPPVIVGMTGAHREGLDAALGGERAERPVRGQAGSGSDWLR